MPDIFNRDVSKLGGTFSADGAKLTLKGNLGVLVQNLQFTYAQSITRLWEVGGPHVYYIGGRTQGQTSIQRVIGPQTTVIAFYNEYGDVCNPKGMTITLQPRCNTAENAANGTKTRYTMKNAVITQVGASVAAQDMVINENTQLMYSALEAE